MDLDDLSTAERSEGIPMNELPVRTTRTLVFRLLQGSQAFSVLDRRFTPGVSLYHEVSFGLIVTLPRSLL